MPGIHITPLRVGGSEHLGLTSRMLVSARHPKFQHFTEMVLDPRPIRRAHGGKQGRHVRVILKQPPHALVAVDGRVGDANFSRLPGDYPGSFRT